MIQRFPNGGTQHFANDVTINQIIQLINRGYRNILHKNTTESRGPLPLSLNPHIFIDRKSHLNQTGKRSS